MDNILERFRIEKTEKGYLKKDLLADLLVSGYCSEDGFEEIKEDFENLTHPFGILPVQLDYDPYFIAVNDGKNYLVADDVVFYDQPIEGMEQNGKIFRIDEITGDFTFVMAEVKDKGLEEIIRKKVKYMHDTEYLQDFDASLNASLDYTNT